MINKTILENYICQNPVAWQKWDGVIEIAHGVGSPSFVDLNTLWSDLLEDLTVVSRNEMLDTSFADLAKWSTEDDILVLAGNEVLLCIPRFEYEKLVA